MRSRLQDYVAAAAFAAAALAAAPIAYSSQAVATESNSLTLPLPGVHYRYWPEQIVQWVGPELPYSMVILNVDSRGKQAVYDLQLIDKSGKNVSHYTNSAEEAAIDRAAKYTVYQVPMILDGPATPENGSQYQVRFVTEQGKPVIWQFVLGTDLTDQGSGLSPVPAAIPVLLYSGLGGLAGQGTALKVGDVTSVAAQWTQIAQPPYFVPYRGAFFTDVQVLTFLPGNFAWKLNGSSLVDGDGSPLQVIKNDKGITMSDASLGTTAEYTTSSGGISRVTFGPEHHGKDDTVSLDFSPALAPGDTQSRFDVVVGKNHKIAGGMIQSGATTTGQENFTWSFQSPSDLRGKQAKSSASLKE